MKFKRKTFISVMMVTLIVAPTVPATAATPSPRIVKDQTRNGTGDVFYAPGSKAAVGETGTKTTSGLTRFVTTLKLPEGAHEAAAAGNPVKVTFNVYKVANLQGNTLTVASWAGKSTRKSAKKDYSRTPAGSTTITPRQSSAFSADVTAAAAVSTTGTIVVRFALTNNPSKRDRKLTQITISRSTGVNPKVKIGTVGNDNDVNTNDVTTTTGNTTAGTGVTMTAAQTAVVNQINTVRAAGHTCTDGVTFPPAGPLTVDTRLTDAAQGHTNWMAENGVFSHTGENGSTVGDRVTSNDYLWRTVGENIAAGQSTAETAVAGWLNSPGHCHNLMNAAFKDTGVGYINLPGSPYGYYWTQNFATTQ